jgi:hypothetical protein
LLAKIKCEIFLGRFDPNGDAGQFWEAIRGQTVTSEDDNYEALPHTPQGVMDSLTSFSGRVKRMLRLTRPQGQDFFSFIYAQLLRK